MVTGKIRFRANWRGKLILQVEEEFTYVIRITKHKAVRWRDAEAGDLFFYDFSKVNNILITGL